MKSRILLCLVSMAGLLLAAQPALAASAAVREMAGLWSIWRITPAMRRSEAAGHRRQPG